MTFEESERQAELEALASQLHDRCVHAEACDRAADMHTVEETHDWLRCEECTVYEDAHCPVLLSGMMRCKGGER